MLDHSKPLKCPVCQKEVPCISKVVSLYCLSLHIAAKWDDEDHLRWRREHGIKREVYQSIGHVQTMVRQIMAALPQHDMTQEKPRGGFHAISL